jgi:hypothetical protein
MKEAKSSSLWLTIAVGAAKGIIGGHNDPSNVEGWIYSTTPDLVILEKVSVLELF